MFVGIPGGGGNFHRVKCHGLKNLHSMRLASFYSDLGGIRSTINWAMKKTLVLGIALPSYITGIIITHCKDPYQPTSIMESKAVFFSWLNLFHFQYSGPPVRVTPTGGLVREVSSQNAQTLQACELARSLFRIWVLLHVVMATVLLSLPQLSFLVHNSLPGCVFLWTKVYLNFVWQGETDVGETRIRCIAVFW